MKIIYYVIKNVILLKQKSGCIIKHNIVGLGLYISSIHESALLFKIKANLYLSIDIL